MKLMTLMKLTEEQTWRLHCLVVRMANTAHCPTGTWQALHDDAQELLTEIEVLCGEQQT